MAFSRFALSSEFNSLAIRQVYQKFSQTMQHVLEQPESPTKQLALDEALLLLADERSASPDVPPTEFIRFWQFESPTVVLGRSSRIDEEVDATYCDAHRIPIYRRCTGGASVVGGPRCMMYSVVLDCNLRPELVKIDVAHGFVMNRLLKAVQRQVPEAELQGTCDLTIQNRKFSGNSMRMARNHVLYHGTILWETDLALVARCLKIAPRQPEYRGGRDHEAFITNVAIDPLRLQQELLAEFGSSGIWQEPFPEARVNDLCKSRYDRKHKWHRSR